MQEEFDSWLEAYEEGLTLVVTPISPLNKTGNVTVRQAQDLIFNLRTQ